MNSVQRLDRLLSASEKPVLHPVDGALDFEEDVLVVCGGFEDRAFESLKRITGAASGRLKVVVVDYLPKSLFNRTEEILRHCSQAGLDARVVQYDRLNPSGGGEAIVDNLPQGVRRIWLDISAMSRLLIVQMLVALGQRSVGFGGVSLLYADAQDYPPTKERVQQELAKSALDPSHAVMFLSSGVFDVTVVPELSSVAQCGQPIRLVAFPCFIVHQLVALRAETPAAHFTIIHGIPPRNENSWRPEAIAKLNHVAGIPSKEEFSVSTLDYRETLNLLLRLYGMHGTMERLIVAPTGSKMQAVAVGVFRSYFDDIQIVYPTPRDFAPPSEYTRGVRQLYVLQLDSFPGKS